MKNRTPLFDLPKGGVLPWGVVYMEMIYNEIQRLKELEEDYKIIRIIRAYMAYYNVRKKTLCDNLNVSKSTLSKILNEKKQEVSNEVWNEVIFTLLKKIDFHKLFNDIHNFDTMTKETRWKIDELENKLEQYRNLKMKYLSNL